MLWRYGECACVFFYFYSSLNMRLLLSLVCDNCVFVGFRHDQAAAPVEAVVAALPSGWEELHTDDGTPYYFHAANSLTQWDRP